MILTNRSWTGMGMVLNKILDQYLSLDQIHFKLIKEFRGYVVQEPKEKRRGSLSFNSRVWQPCGSKYTLMLLYILARRHFEKGTGDSKFTYCSPE